MPDFQLSFAAQVPATLVQRALRQRLRRARTTQETRQSQRAKFGKKDKIVPILPECSVFRFLRVDQATAAPVCQDSTCPKAPNHSN